MLFRLMHCKGKEKPTGRSGVGVRALEREKDQCIQEAKLARWRAGGNKIEMRP